VSSVVGDVKMKNLPREGSENKQLKVKLGCKTIKIQIRSRQKICYTLEMFKEILTSTTASTWKD